MRTKVFRQIGHQLGFSDIAFINPFKNLLSADYIFVRGEIDSNVPMVTTGQKQQLATLDAQWKVLRTEMTNLINKEIAAFNKLCADKALTKVIVP